MSQTWTALAVLDWTARRFDEAGIEGGRLEAQVLLSHVLDCDRMALYTNFDQPLGEPERAAFRGLIRRRLAGEPVAYLTGEKEFWSLPFTVDKRVLIPRPDTETLIEVVLDAVTADGGDKDAPLKIVEVATGSGAIAITLATQLRGAAVVATDISSDALEVAAANVSRHSVADRVELRRGDLLAPAMAAGPFDVVVANLPYVASGDIDTLSREVRTEPRAALDGGVDGLDLIRRLVGEVKAIASPGALVALEHGHDQGQAVRELLTGAGLAGATTRRDLAGNDRVSSARVPSPARQTPSG